MIEVQNSIIYSLSTNENEEINLMIFKKDEIKNNILKRFFVQYK